LLFNAAITIVGILLAVFINLQFNKAKSGETVKGCELAETI